MGGEKKHVKDLAAKPGKRGPKFKIISNENVEIIKTLAARGLSITDIAAILKIPITTFERRLADQPEIRKAIAYGRAFANSEVGRTAFEMAKSGEHPSMTMYWLNKRAGWDKDKNKETQSEAEQKLSDEQRQAKIEELLKMRDRINNAIDVTPKN